MDGPFLLGIDVGTTSVKAALFDQAGRQVRVFQEGYPTQRPAPGFVEQDPRDWTRLVTAALGELTDGLPAGAIGGAGLCSQVNTHVFVDERGEALLPAIVWQDGRCAAEAAVLDRLVPEADRLKWWGAPLPIDASHVLARMAHVRERFPEIWRRTRWVMAPKDYCLLHLTGEAVADPMSSFGVIDQSLAYIGTLVDLVPGAREKLPPLKGSTEMAGRIRKGLPGAGVPLATATMDAWSGMIGAGVSGEGDAVYLSGTSEVVGIVSSRRVPTPGVIAFPECEGIVVHAGPTQAGGASVAWMARLLGRSPDGISELVEASNPELPTPIFLPHLQGERAPLWDPAARASFSGVDGSMGPAELSRAVMEGVAYSVRLLMDSLEQSAGRSVDTLTHSGGGARSDIWCQIRADVLGRVLKRTANTDSGVLGAAIFAGVSSGLYASIGEASKALVAVERVFEPNPGRRARHDEGFARYVDLYTRLKGFG